MFLVDTNVWLELLLLREKADDVRNFFHQTDARSLALSEFSLYSIGVILTKLNKGDLFEEFLSDVIVDSRVLRIRLTAEQLKQAVAAMRKFKIDFDDAYQYVAAVNNGYTLISFDKDFDRTGIRKTPKQVLQKRKK